MRVKTLVLDTVFISMMILVGCISLGGTNSAVKPETVAKLETALKQAQDQIDKSSQAIDANNSTITTMKTNISNATSIQTTLQKQITAINTTTIQHNESIKGLLWTIAGIYMAFKAAGFIQMCIAARVMPGKTVKNFFTLPFGNKEKDDK